MNEEDVLEQVKTDYLNALKAHADSAKPLATTILAAIDEFDTPTEAKSQLITWGVQAGYSESWVRNCVNTALRSATGKRQRKEGAGRQTPQQALAAYSWAQAQWGNDAAKYLLAAYRYAKTQKPQSAVKAA